MPQYIKFACEICANALIIREMKENGFVCAKTSEWISATEMAENCDDFVPDKEVCKSLAVEE